MIKFFLVAAFGLIALSANALQPNIISSRWPASWLHQSRPGKCDWSQPESKKMVSGKPYISAKSATMNALNAPKLRQSRPVAGLKKLYANRMNTEALTSASPQRP